MMFSSFVIHPKFF